MKIPKREWLQILIVAFPFCVAAALWNKLPDPMPNHWGINGQVDGYASKPVAALLDVVLLDIYTVDGRHSQDGIAFIIKLALAVASLNHAELAFEDFRQEVACPAGRFEEARVNPFGLGLHKIKHGVYF